MTREGRLRPKRRRRWRGGVLARSERPFISSPPPINRADARALDRMGLELSPGFVRVCVIELGGSLHPSLTRSKLCGADRNKGLAGRVWEAGMSPVWLRLPRYAK